MMILVNYSGNRLGGNPAILVARRKLTNEDSVLGKFFPFFWSDLPSVFVFLRTRRFPGKFDYIVSLSNQEELQV